MSLARLAALAYFMAPAYVANMAAPFARYWRGWNPPVSRRWLGTHKTVIGALAGVAAAILTTLVQSRVPGPALVDYRAWPALGVRFGAGAMLGDCVKSFFKRRRGVPPGAPWRPFDQIDFVVGALVLAGPAAPLHAADVVAIVVVSAIGHVVVNHVGYWLGVRDVKW